MMNLLLENVHVYLFPLIVVVSLVYSATRFEDWKLIWQHSFRWAAYILTFLGGTYLFLWLLTLGWSAYWYVLIVIGILIGFNLPGRIGAKSKADSPESKSEEPAAEKSKIGSGSDERSQKVES